MVWVVKGLGFRGKVKGLVFRVWDLDGLKVRV